MTIISYIEKHVRQVPHVSHGSSYPSSFLESKAYVYRFHFSSLFTLRCPLRLMGLLFFAHLSRKLKWAFLITCGPWSVRPSVCPSVRLSVDFSHFHLLLQNHWANFNQTWHKVSLVKWDSSLFKWRAPPFSKGR